MQLDVTEATLELQATRHLPEALMRPAAEAPAGPASNRIFNRYASILLQHFSIEQICKYLLRF